MIPFPNFESSILQRRMLAKGKELFESDASTRVETQNNGVWNIYFTAETANNEYKVTFQIKDGWVFYYHCPCPSLKGPMCEHSVAALFEIRTQYEEQQSQGGGFESEDDEEEPRESRRSRRSNRNDKDKRKKSFTAVDPLQLERDEKPQWELTQTEKEFECQVCLSSLKGPVLLPCQCHSVCYSCLEDLFAHKKRERDGKRSLNCPTCGVKSGLLRIRKIEGVQVNKELKNIMKSYHSLRQAWEEEKTNLQIQIAEKRVESIKFETDEKIRLAGNVFLDALEEEESDTKNNKRRLKRKNPLPPKADEDLKIEEEAQLNRLKKLRISSKKG